MRINGHKDLEGLIARLPDIHEGAGKWIKTFEEETMGKLLAVGDIKALLAKILGGTKIEEILKASDLERAVDSCYMDGTVSDSYRPVVWQTLRAEYPTRVDPKALKGDQLGEIESPIIYIQKQLKKWKQETEGNPEGDPLMATLFRNAIIDAMPQPVKSKVEDVVGLNSKTHKEFSVQLTQAPAVQMTPPARIPPNTCQTPIPIIHIHAQQPGMMQRERKMVQVNQTGKGRSAQWSEECWICGQLGHKSKRCPFGSWTASRDGKGRLAPAFSGSITRPNIWHERRSEYLNKEKLLLQDIQKRLLVSKKKIHNSFGAVTRIELLARHHSRLNSGNFFQLNNDLVGHNKASTKSDSNDQQSDESYPDLQSLCRQEDTYNTRRIEKDAAISVEVCGARQSAQSRVEGVETVPSVTPILQLQAVHTALGPKDIERLSQSLPSARTNFSEFRRAMTSKMRLYMLLAEVTQRMSQILTESEFNSFESAGTSELQHASKVDLREGVLKILKNIMGPKIDWSRITNCVQRKEETVNEYTVRFCQTAVTYSGIVDDSESVLDDKGTLVRIWSDGFVAEYRKALPFLDLTWSNKTLRSNLDMLAIWERDSDVKARVKIAAASFQVNTKNQT
ncbi:Gag-Pol polyprotein [Labeo rohita]|uniref:Gag-Pol polyprotein n=1 Tax=Labeo rohita TaxID=84645 RepID=A0ABQ8KZM6_LABRO|nr:Gag-Pol polyprotein [Labeo rohita]